MAVLITALAAYLVRERSRNMEKLILQKGIVSARTGARVLGHILDSVIDDGFFTINEVFDYTLVPVELPENITKGYKDVSPEELEKIQKYHYTTNLDSHLDNIILEIEDKFMEDPQVKYAALLDVNGYPPCHNSCYSQRLTGDFIYDRDNNRTKRIFNDEVAVKANRNVDKSYLFQVYYRDTGETMWDISSPVFVKARHWGTFRVGIDMETVHRDIVSMRWKLILLMGILLIVTALVVILVTSLMMRPLRFLHSGVEQVAKGNLTYRQEIITNDEIGDLSRAFNKMVGDLREHVEQLKQTTAAKEKMESELKIAHNIQMGIVPKIFPAFPDMAEFDIYARLEPARQVGGDLYDFFFIDPDHLCFVIGDVSDKGVPASLFMAVTTTLIKSVARELRSPERILERINKEISHDNESCMFVTIFCGIINIRTGRVQYSNAGHNLPIVIRHGQEQEADFLKSSAGIAVGIKEDFIFTKDSIVLSPNDTIFMYTDGVTEAVNSEMELFSEDRLKDKISAYRQESSKTLVDNTLQEVETFAQGTAQADDITIMALRFLGSEGEAIKLQKKAKTIILDNDLSELRRLGEVLKEFGKKNQLPEKLIFNVNLALEELITNTVSYGYEDNIGHQIIVELKLKEDELTLKVEDDARPFNPLDVPEPDVSKSLEERKPGQLGIFFVRKLMDKLEYKREQDKNILIMETKLKKEEDTVA